MPSLTFRRRFDLSTLPRDWIFVRAALDSSGSPLLLMAEGKLPEPEPGDAAQAWSLWYRSPARAHHLIYWEEDRPQTLRFEQSQAHSIYHVQPLDDGWLLAERRRGRAIVYDRKGRVCAEVDLGDASEDVQTTPDGDIWVSYFGEGVFGGSLGADGVICFDRTGTPIFRYRDFAEKHNLPPIHDAHAMNVSGPGEVWLNYSSDFPLVLLRDFTLENFWPRFGPVGNAFALRDGAALYLRDAQFMRAPLDRSTGPEVLPAVNELGFPLTPIAGRASIAARGATLILKAGQFLYECLC